jgi:hypothetical protein
MLSGCKLKKRIVGERGFELRPLVPKKPQEHYLIDSLSLVLLSEHGITRFSDIN